MLLLNITSDRTVVPLKMMYPKGHNIACAKDTSESNHEETSDKPTLKDIIPNI